MRKILIKTRRTFLENEVINLIAMHSGFTTGLDELKAYLEHNFNLNLIGYKSQREISNH